MWPFVLEELDNAFTTSFIELFGEYITAQLTCLLSCSPNIYKTSRFLTDHCLVQFTLNFLLACPQIKVNILKFLSKHWFEIFPFDLFSCTDVHAFLLDMFRIEFQYA